MDATTSMTLGLAPHVRARSCEDQVILLDLRTCRYVGVGPMACAALSRSVKGWPSAHMHPSVAPPPQESIDINALTQRFIAEGLLSDLALERPIEPSIATADTSLDFEDLSMGIEIGVRRIAHFLKAAVTSALRLRFQSLESIASAVSARRRRHHPSETASPSDSLASMRSSAIVYERLRPFLFTSHRKCLLDSLTLLEFLSSEELFPYWVIGVKTGPFGAHSWVQFESTVLNDQHTRVRQFHPILVA